jgi:thiol-disulfide isomerase/thioredoxin
LIAATSTLPVIVSDGARWRALDPAAQPAETLRPAPKAGPDRWPEGPCTLRLRAQIAGAPVVLHRVTARLIGASGPARLAATALTDADGEATLRLPAGRWRVVAVVPSAGGAHRDLAFAAALSAPTEEVTCAAGAEARLALPLRRLDPPPPPPALPAAARAHPLVGKPLPPIAVRRWLGEGAAAPRAGRALLLYAWATWCGPCKQTSPVVTELAARGEAAGVRVVFASVDRDEAALEDAVAAMPPDGPPVAHCGGELMATLQAPGIPTFVLVDAQGVVRAVHTGVGVPLARWEAELAALTGAAPASDRGASAPAPGAQARPPTGGRRPPSR